MQWTGFGMRAAAVFLTTVVMFAAMIVISHSLKMTSAEAPFRPAAGRDVSAGEPVESDSDWQWPDARLDLGPLRHVGTVPSEPTPVVTAAPVPDDSDDTAIARAATGDGTTPSASAGGEPGTTVVATPLPSGERGPAPERDPRPVATQQPASPPQPAPAPAPQPTPTPSTDPDPQPVPQPAPEPTPSEDGSESPSEALDESTADAATSESPTP